MSQFYPRRRNSLRCIGHDYSGRGAYLVTVCVAGRLPVLGMIESGSVRLSALGQVAWREWEGIGEQFESVQLDEMIVMPDHLHGILCFSRLSGDSKGDSSNHPSYQGSQHDSLGAVVGQFKSRVTKAALKESLWPRGERLWQRGYHDRVLRSAEALVRARIYVRMNPIRWSAPQKR